jgi:hydroxymethylbilane synthase
MRLGTRGSDLALWQANHVAERLRAAGHDVEVVTITTKGDRIVDVPLAEIGDKGLFTQELDEALLDGSIQLAVHSLKDLPTNLPDGLTLAAVPAREDSADAFVAHADFRGVLEDLPSGAVLATSSLRRQAQILAWRPDLRVVPVRGNVPTRIAKLDASGMPGEGGWHGIILAVAGLMRLGLVARVTERISSTVMLPAVSQGALGVVTAVADEATTAAVRAALDDQEASVTTTAERSLLRRLEGGCQVPVAARARIVNSSLHLEGAVASLDGARLFRARMAGEPARADTLGVALAEHLLAEGADAVLAAIRHSDA